MENSGTAAAEEQPNTALEQIKGQQTALAPVSYLDRENLTFFANMIDAAGLVPYDKNVTKDVQKARVMAKIVGGVAYHFDPIGAQENLHVIQGRLVLSARGMAILLKRAGKYDTRIKQLDDDGCVIDVLERREDGVWILKGTASFTREHAKASGLLTSNSAMYTKWGPDMFYANCIKRVVRRFAPEVLDGHLQIFALAKDAPPPPAPPQQQITEGDEPPPAENGAAKPGEEYVDAEYQDVASAEVAALADDAVEADFVEAEVVDDEKEAPALFTEEEGKRVDLENAVQDLLTEKVGNAAEQKKYLKGKPLDQMPVEELTKLHGDLIAL